MSDEPFNVITSLRYDSVAPYSNSENDGPTDLYRLHAHVRRLERSVAAVGWQFDRQTTWSQSKDRILWIAGLIRQAAEQADKHGEDSITISESELADSTSSLVQGRHEQSWRVRVDLLPPTKGGTILLTLARVPAIKIVTTFDPFFPEALPSPEQTIKLVPRTWNVVISKDRVPVDIHTERKTSKRDVYNAARKNLDLGTEILLLNTEGQIMDASISTPYLWNGHRWITPSASCGGQMGVSREYALAKGLASEGTVHARDLTFPAPVWLSNGVRGFSWGMLEESSH